MNSDASVHSHPAGVRGKLRYPAMVEFVILGGLAVILMIALAMIGSLVKERAHRAAGVRGEIASSWGQPQTIGGAALLVPYRVRTVDAHGRPQILIAQAGFLPDRLHATGKLVTQPRRRGIYETVVYRASLKIDGVFARPDFSSWSVLPEDILWSQAVFTTGITDLRGIRGNPQLRWGAETIAFSGGSPDPRLWTSGLTAAIPSAGDAAGPVPFSFELELNGSEGIEFLPLGGQTVVELQSPWADPSFAGAFLPEWRVIDRSGFRARWVLSSLARSYPQRWRSLGDGITASIATSGFRVNLFTPVGGYQKTERSVKYGALFIILTFLTFFLYELLSPVSLHPMQYFLVGGALCVFYLLLLSISEHATFGLAYGIASVVTVALIVAYGAALLKSSKRVAGLAGVLSLLYGYLYVLLQLEDWALLMGSIGLFVILALVMYATRKVDWASAHVARPQTASA